jgi:hypothetical protein
MFLSNAARKFYLGLMQTKRRRTRSRLGIESLEDRAVPANNLTIVDGTTDTNIDLPQGNGATSVFQTTGADAELSLATIQAELQKPNVRTVVITTEAKNPPADNDQAGDIRWDASVVGSLDFSGFGTGKTLIFRTVDGTNAVGDITLTAVAFVNGGSDDQISLEFDSSATGGDITFQTDGVNSDTVSFSAEAVKDLTIDADSGAFRFTNEGGGTPLVAADFGGAVSITAGDVTISSEYGVTAFGSLSIVAEGNVLLDPLTGLMAGTDLTVNALGTFTASDGGLTAQTGKISIKASDVSLTQTSDSTPLVITAPGGLFIEDTTSIELDGGTYNVQGDVSLTSTGAITVIGIEFPDQLLGPGRVGDTIISGDEVTLEATKIFSDGSIAITGTSINLIGNEFLADGNLHFAGPVRLKGDIYVLSNGNVSFNDAVDGTALEATNLYLAADGTLTFADDIGPVNPLDSLTLFEGNMSLGGNKDLSAAEVTIGQLSNAIEATLGMDGTLTGNLVVLATGNLSPGGIGTVGTMNVTGNVNLVGDYAVDFGTLGATDRLNVTGNLTIGPNSMLGAGLGSGNLSVASAIIIDYGGNLSGTFVNASVDVPVLVGTDAVTVTSYGSGNNDDVVVAPYTVGQGTTIFGVELFPNDATGFKAVLTGGGTLVSGRDWEDSLFLVARGTTVLSRLTITTIANGSDDVVTFQGGVLVSGPLVSFIAPKVNIAKQFRASGFVGLATFRDFQNLSPNTGVQFVGFPSQLTTIVSRNIVGSVRIGSTLNVLRVAQTLGAQVNQVNLEDSVVSAPAIGRVIARTARTNFITPGKLTAITLTGDYLGDITAASLGTFSAGLMLGDVKTTGGILSFRTTGAFEGSIAATSIGKFDVGGGSVATLKTTGPITSILGRGEGGLTLELSASQVGPIRVEGELAGDGNDDGPDLNVTNGITSLIVGSISDMDLKAKFMGVVAVNGNLTFGISGNISNSTFTLTGNDGTLLENAMKLFVAKGNVRDSRFDIQGGNVPAFTVGRFLNSKLYLNYTPDDSGDFTLGNFAAFGNGGYRLGSFKTTAVPTIDPNHPLHWAFQGSEVVANAIGTVTLSGLQTDNGGTGFGIKVRSVGTIIKVLKADETNDPDMPLNMAFNPDRIPPLEALVGDFFYLDV